MTGARWAGAGGCPTGYQRHHLIPLALRRRPQLDSFFLALQRDGLNLGHFSENGLSLPANERLAAITGHAMHRGPHPAYSDVVAARVEFIRRSAILLDLRSRLAAAARIRLLQLALRRSLTDRHGLRFRLNRRDPMRIFADRAYLDEAIGALFGGD